MHAPVASISIRGTLYSAHYRNNQLSADVWQGGIQLRTKQGVINLGEDSDFQFGAVNEQGFQGFLTPPLELTNVLLALSTSNNAHTNNSESSSFNSDNQTTNQKLITILFTTANLLKIN